MHPISVLFVDDDPDVLQALGNYFDRLGHTVHRAASGHDALALWHRVRPEVTVLDLYMPGMTGLDVLRALQRQRATVIMLTAHGDVESAVEAMRLGAESFLAKPIEMSHLLQAVEKAAEKAALRREVATLRGRITPSVRRRLARLALLVGLIVGSIALGRLMGRRSASAGPVSVERSDTVP